MNFKFPWNKTAVDQSPASVRLGDLLSRVEPERNEICDSEYVLDVAEVDCVDSCELGQVVNLHLRLRDANCRLVFENASRDVAEIIKLTRLNRLVELRHSQPA